MRALKLNKTASRSGIHLIAGLSLIIGLAACGGGGGGGSSGNGITLPTAPVTITQTNAPQVAGAGVDAAYGGINLPAGAQTTVSAPAPSAASAAQSIAKIGQKAAQRILLSSTAPAIVTGAVTSYPCTVSGTISYDPAASSGTMTYTNCSDMSGETVNGTISVSNGVQTTSDLTADTFLNLTIATTNPANTLTVIGNMHIFTSYNYPYASTISGTSLSIANTAPALGNFGLQNYSISYDVTAITAMTFTFASTVINGTAVFTMTTPFTTGAGKFPSSGAATITGAASTKLRLTVLGDENAAGNQVRLELSTDGGTTYAAPTYESWANLSNNI